MAVRLIDDVSGVNLPLWNSQEYRNEVDAAVDAYSAMGFDTGDTFLTSLEQLGSVSLSGEVTAGRLAQDARFSSNRREALAQWVLLFHKFVDGGQSEDGYQLYREYAGEYIRGVIENATTTVRGGEPYSAEWNLSFLPGQSSGVSGDPLQYPDVNCPVTSEWDVCPGGDYLIDGHYQFTIDEFQIETSQTWEVYRRALADTVEDNDLFPETGATRRITIMSDVTGAETERETTYDDVSESLGQNQTITVRDALTGQEYSGVIGSFDSTDESGMTRLGEFGMEIVQGDVQ